MCRHFSGPCSLDNTGQPLDTMFTVLVSTGDRGGGLNYSAVWARGLFTNSNVFYVKDLNIYGIWNPPGSET